MEGRFGRGRIFCINILRLSVRQCQLLAYLDIRYLTRAPDTGQDTGDPQRREVRSPAPVRRLEWLLVRVWGPAIRELWPNYFYEM